jgi:tellurite resistance protein TehA-like permease
MQRRREGMAGNGYGLAPLSSIENFIIYFCIILKILFIIIYITKFIYCKKKKKKRLKHWHYYNKKNHFIPKP